MTIEPAKRERSKPGASSALASPPRRKGARRARPAAPLPPSRFSFDCGGGGGGGGALGGAGGGRGGEADDGVDGEEGGDGVRVEEAQKRKEEMPRNPQCTTLQAGNNSNGSRR